MGKRKQIFNHVVTVDVPAKTLFLTLFHSNYARFVPPTKNGWQKTWVINVYLSDTLRSSQSGFVIDEKEQ